MNMRRTYIIAEAGVNHNGSEDMALKLVEVAAQAGADAIKFQTFKADNLVIKGTATADYQKNNSGDDDQYLMLKKLELSEDLHLKLIKHCKQFNIEFLSTPFDISSAKMLLDFGMKRIKIPSGELTNLPLIKNLAELNCPVILSTGMASLGEVNEAVDVIRQTRNKLNLQEPLEHILTLLHCTSNYPAKTESVNLKAMQTMADYFSLPVGYSDHTDGIVIAIAAVAMGAKVIEKHFTLDRGLPGPDHKASLEPDELEQMVSDIRKVENCFGNGQKEPQPDELPVRKLVRRSICLARNMASGEVIKEGDLQMLRPGTGIPPGQLQLVIGKQLKSSLQSGSMISWQDLY